jgi:hypothetical protein
MEIGGDPNLLNTYPNNSFGNMERKNGSNKLYVKKNIVGNIITHRNGTMAIIGTPEAI